MELSEEKYWPVAFEGEEAVVTLDTFKSKAAAEDAGRFFEEGWKAGRRAMIDGVMNYYRKENERIESGYYNQYK